MSQFSFLLLFAICTPLYLVRPFPAAQSQLHSLRTASPNPPQAVGAVSLAAHPSLGSNAAARATSPAYRSAASPVAALKAGAPVAASSGYLRSTSVGASAPAAAAASSASASASSVKSPIGAKTAASGSGGAPTMSAADARAIQQRQLQQQQYLQRVQQQFAK